MKRIAESRYARICLTIPTKNDLKQGDAPSPLLFNFALNCASMRVQVNQDGLKLNGKHHFLVILIYWEEACILLGKTQKL